MVLKLCLLLFMILLTCTQKFYSQAGECVDSGQTTVDNKQLKNIFIPKHCVPTTCKVTTSSSRTVDGFNCTIKNGDKSPTACKDFERSLGSAGGHISSPPLTKVCQATLSRISIYIFTCSEVPTRVPSLNFTFDLPTCEKNFSGPHDAVMAVFSARNKTMDFYYTVNPICRVFSFGSNDLQRFSHNDSIQVWSDCMGMGLGLRSSISRALYYLSLTTFPSGAVLNYSIIHLVHVSEGLRLLTAAWRSTRRIHVLFETVVGVASYLVQAKGEQFFFSKKVSSSSPSLEIEDIPPHVSIVTVKVTPVELDHGECPSIHLPCSPIEVTLHDKGQLNVPVEPQQPEGNKDDAEMKVAGVVTAGVVVIALIFILIGLIIRRKRRLAVPGEETRKLNVLTANSAPEDGKADKIMEELRKRGFIVTDVFDNQGHSSSGNVPTPTVFQDQDVVLLFIHPTAQSQQRSVQGVVEAIFQMRLVEKTRVVSLIDKHGHRVKPSEVFSQVLIHFNSVRRQEFLDSLDGATFYLPEDWDRLVGHLKDLSHPGSCTSVTPCQKDQGKGVWFGKQQDKVSLDGEDCSTLLGSLSDADRQRGLSTERCVKWGRPYDGIPCRGDVHGESLGAWSDANSSVSSQEQGRAVRTEAQVHSSRDRESSLGIARGKEGSDRALSPAHRAADIPTCVETYRQQSGQNGMFPDPWIYKQQQHQVGPHSSCETPPGRRFMGQLSDVSRSLNMFTQSCGHARDPNPMGQPCHNSQDLNPMGRPCHNSQDQQGGEQAQDSSEDTAVKTPVPSAQRVNSGRAEGRNRPQLHQEPFHNQTGTLQESRFSCKGCSGSQSGIRYEQSSWPVDCRLAPEGRSVPDGLDHGRSGKESRSPPVSQHCPAQCPSQSDHYHSSASQDFHYNSSQRNVGPTLNPERQVNGGEGVETVTPNFPPVTSNCWGVGNERLSSLVARGVRNSHGDAEGQNGPVPIAGIQREPVEDSESSSESNSSNGREGGVNGCLEGRQVGLGELQQGWQ
ncbi:hypothetical protein ACOMHN_021558 [Nucella lapillus]